MDEHTVDGILYSLRKKKDKTLDWQEFGLLMNELLISEDGYVCDCCTNDQGNYIVMQMLCEKIKEHPWLWKKFFMVA